MAVLETSPTEGLQTLFDVLHSLDGSVDVSGPCVGDDREQTAFYESLGPSVGDDDVGGVALTVSASS
jgi:hypothetical protein